MNNETDTSKISKYTYDTWRSLVMMVDPETGLAADKVALMATEAPVMTHLTSPTNIGLFFSCLIAARDLQIIEEEEFGKYASRALFTLERLERHNGLYYNWYNTTDGSLPTSHPKFISTVDNAWLMAGLITLKSAYPEYEKRVNTILDKADFAFLYDKEQKLFHGGYDIEKETLTQWHYGLLNTEARIATYVGMSYYNIPVEHYAQLSNYSSMDGSPVFPSWGGSMFEVFMPSLFINECQNKNWGQIYQYHLQKQIEAGGLSDGFWGFSPCEDPEGIYKEFGVPHLAVKPGGYGTGYVITPHAIFLALSHQPEEAIKTLGRLEELYPKCYDSGFGFVDSINTKTGNVSTSRLILDQAMSFLSLYNYQTSNKLHSYSNFAVPELLEVA